VLAEAIREMLAWAREGGVAIGFKDLGAGGISCAASEMAEAAGLGASIDLDKVNTAFDDMLPEVISCSETQERFLLAVPERLAGEASAIFNEHFEMPNLYTGAGAYRIGEVTTDKRFKIAHKGRLVSDSDVEAITTGILYEREARERKRALPSRGRSHAAGADGVREALLELLSSYNICDKSAIFQHYDSEVQGRAVIRPGEADAAVAVFMPGEKPGLAAAIGGSSRLATADPYLGGVWSVVEAVRNCVCVGAMPLAITDCLNYGDPEDPGVFYEFSEGVRGIGDACRALQLDAESGDGVPVVSGNVSFYNQSETGDPIAPTPIVSCTGRIDDAARARNMAFKKAGSTVVYLGRFHDRLGGSEYERHYGSPDPHNTPRPDYDTENAILKAILGGIENGDILAAHDVSHGGVLVSAAEMVLASRPYLVGCELDFTEALDSSKPLEHQLFSEFGGILIEVDAGRRDAFCAALDAAGVVYHCIGETRDGGALSVGTGDGRIEVAAGELKSAVEGKVAGLLG
jgi:phosphoribosylformylglycinamidine synthase